MLLHTCFFYRYFNTKIVEDIVNKLSCHIFIHIHSLTVFKKYCPAKYQLLYYSLQDVISTRNTVGVGRQRDDIIREKTDSVYEM